MTARRTVAAPVTLAGPGLHSGRPCAATVAPAAPGSGLRINGAPARVDAVADARLATTLATPLGPVCMVEHLLAALLLAGIDDAALAVEGGEVPVLDGSAAPWLAALRPRAHGGLRRPLVLTRPVEARAGDGVARAEPAPALRLEVETCFPGLGVQRFSGAEPELADALGDARTFGWLAHAAALHARGRALGASLDNTVVLDDEGRPRNPGGWRRPDEAVRHKALDLLGDLALLGAPLQARVTVSRGGHALHHALVGALLEALAHPADRRV